MNNLSRRMLIITGCAVMLPARLFAADDSRERLAESLIAEAVNAGRGRLAPELPELQREPVLDAIARERSIAMANGAPFDHQDERGAYPTIDKIRARYSRAGAMGENIMMQFDPAGHIFEPRIFAGQAVKSWLDSQGHRDNIVSPFFIRCGIGVAASRTMVYATQVFWGSPPKRSVPRS